VSAGATPVGDTYRPIYEPAAINARGAVSFDGVADTSGINGSDVGAAFFHTTGAFDLVIVMRPDTTTYGAPIGSTPTGADRGMLVDVNFPIGSSCIYLLHGGAANTSFCPITGVVAGDWARFEFWGDGTTVFGARNNGSVSSQTMAAHVAGNATRVLSIGSSSVDNQQYPFDGAIAYVGIINRPLTAGERTAVHAALSCRYGL
jgi:hypothetical protein